MPASIKVIGDPIKWFEAKWPGVCGVCRDSFQAGDWIGYLAGPDDDPDVLIARSCCGDGDGMSLNEGSDFDAFNRGRPTGINVLPRGKSGKDACRRCFIIHTVGQGDDCDG